jgi:hypothetical protein
MQEKPRSEWSSDRDFNLVLPVHVPGVLPTGPRRSVLQIAGVLVPEMTCLLHQKEGILLRSLQ